MTLGYFLRFERTQAYPGHNTIRPKDNRVAGNRLLHNELAAHTSARADWNPEHWPHSNAFAAPQQCSRELIDPTKDLSLLQNH